MRVFGTWKWPITILLTVCVWVELPVSPLTPIKNLDRALGSLILDLFFQGILKTMRTEAERVALQEKRELLQTQMGVDILLK